MPAVLTGQDRLFSKLSGWIIKFFIFRGLAEKCREKIRAALEALEGVTTVSFREKFTEVYLENNVEDAALKMAVEQCGDYTVEKID